MFFFLGDDNNYSIYFYEESENLFVKCIDHLTNYEVSAMIDYIDSLRDSGPKDPSLNKGGCMRSLDFTACIKQDECPFECKRKLTKEEKEWLASNPNRMSYADFGEECKNEVKNV